MLRRLLERPCTLALLVGSQLAVMMYLSLGGFRSLSALFGREQGPTFDYSHPRDVYSNLSHLPGAPPAPQGLPYCPERSPLLGEYKRKRKRWGQGALDIHGVSLRTD
jgi:beta-1,4-galactosyltransferase 3